MAKKHQAIFGSQAQRWWWAVLTASESLAPTQLRTLGQTLARAGTDLAHSWLTLTSWGQRLGWSAAVRERLAAWQKQWPPEQLQTYCGQRDYQLLTLDDQDYPPLLRYLPDAPVALFYQGDLSLWQQPPLAVVGSRRPSDYARSALRQVIDARLTGVTIVSGLMYGLDQLAHEQALRLKTPTAAFLGYGLDRTWPTHLQSLRQRIIAAGGAILSEYAPWSPPLPGHFPHRNRLVAGASLATLVVAATSRSGSLITARLALEYERDVFAVPGSIIDPQGQGGNLLLQQGAYPIIQSQDLVTLLQTAHLAQLPFYQSALARLGPPAPEPALTDPKLQELYQHLKQKPQTSEALASLFQLSPPSVAASLSSLELAGLISRLPDGRFEAMI